VRAIAPEFYNNLFYHMSWTGVLVDFVFDKNLGPQSRVGRDQAAHKRGRKLAIPMPRTDSGIKTE
jgi:sphingolipid 4-desaturase/C4-monooxygenase